MNHSDYSDPCSGRPERASDYWCLAAVCALACCRSTTSMATTFSHAAYNCSRLIPTLTTATGKHTKQIIVKTPNDSGPSGTATRRLITAIHCQLLYLTSNTPGHVHSMTNTQPSLCCYAFLSHS